MVERTTHLAADLHALILRHDEARGFGLPGPVHDETPTFHMIGPGDGQPTGFECSGCGQQWTVRVGQRAEDLIPELREHAAS